MTEPERFRFLNEVHTLTDCGWDSPTLDKLWRYHLHYFDDLNAQGADARAEWHRALLSRWVRENPPAMGTGWEPYPTSLRIVNWIKWALCDHELPSECVHSLAVQARWLSRRLERHLLGNHLLANAKALVYAGLFFDGPEANQWLETGVRILQHEMREQILSDGGHFERTPMYHALVLEDLQDLYNLTAAFQGMIPEPWRSMTEGWWERINPMRSWLAAMCHPDGEIGFFNDTAIDVAPSRSELEHYAAGLGFPALSSMAHAVTRLAESGYIRIQHEEAVALLDVGPIGPDYLPGHAHADTLSFELSLFGDRVFVNSGTSCYGTSTERQRQRGTAAHNTVLIDGEDSSEVWAGFRVARRAVPVGLQVICQDGITVRCAHSGYRRLPGSPEHRRSWSFGRRTLIVDDQVSGRFGHAEARFHLHPAVRLYHDPPLDDEGSAVVLVLPRGQKIRVSVEGGILRKEHTTWHPRFGSAEPNLCLVIALGRSGARTSIDWGNTV